jgi:hypothetical protein
MTAVLLLVKAVKAAAMAVRVVVVMSVRQLSDRILAKVAKGMITSLEVAAKGSGEKVICVQNGCEVACEDED